MIIPCGIHKWELTSTGRVLSTCIAESGWAVSILVNFSSDMGVVENWSLHREMRYLVSVVDNSPLLWEDLIWKSSIVCISSSRLSEVYHWNVESSLYKAHSTQLSKSCSETVSCYLDFVGRVNCLKSWNLCKDIIPYAVNSSVKSSMDLTVALRPSVVGCRVGISVHFWLPIRLSTLKNYVDRFIWWQVASVTFNIPKRVVNYFGRNKARSSFVVFLR